MCNIKLPTHSLCEISIASALNDEDVFSIKLKVKINYLIKWARIHFVYTFIFVIFIKNDIHACCVLVCSILEIFFV